MKRILAIALTLCFLLPGAAMAGTMGTGSYQVPYMEVRDGVQFTGSYAPDLSTAYIQAYSFTSEPRFTLELMVQRHQLTYLSMLYFGAASNNQVRQFLYVKSPTWIPADEGQGLGIRLDTLDDQAHAFFGQLLWRFWPVSVPYEEDPLWPLIMLFSPLAGQAGSYHPLPPLAAENFRQDISRLLGTEMILEKVHFSFAGKDMGTGAQLMAGIPGEKMAYADIWSAITGYFDGKGWSADIQFAAGGPTGEVFAYRKGNALALVKLNWAPVGIDLLPDVPIGAQDIPLDQQVTGVYILLAEN
ncbi:MAG: hypothetical protein WCN99_06020 [bacterium]